MWHDSETNRDFLNFQAVAKTVAELVVQAEGKPLSIGVSGGWGVGKSSMVRLIADALHERGQDRFLFVDFNAWLYQGYDDARAALMDVIARTLVAHGEKSKAGLQKAKDLLRRVDWVRAASITAGSAIAMSMGLPPLGLVGDVVRAARGFADGDVSQEDIDAAKGASEKAIEAGKGLIRPRKVESPPKEIQDLREHFRSTLEEMNVTLVVLIDDLDRCLPPTAIATLEAIRLFLFLDRTAFIIAADDQMIRHAVRAHFRDVTLDDDLVTNYFDKLIQVPIRVPPLGTQDVRAYLMLLFVENSGLSVEVRNRVRERVCAQLAASWQGKRVDRAFMTSVIPECAGALRAQFDLADRLAPLMTTAKQIAGNPRLIKRFLNTLYMRLAVARVQGVSVDEAPLAKMLLFERCGHKDAYSRMVQAINDNEHGKPAFLKPWEERAVAGEELADLPVEWNSEFARSWLALPPSLADLDLRAVVYVSREHLPIITATDRLSTDAAELLEGLMQVRDQTSDILGPRLRQIPKRELSLIMDRLLARARQEQSWGTPGILYACLTVAGADPDQGTRLAEFLQGIPGTQLTASLIPVLFDRPWAKSLMERWQCGRDTPDRVKRAIQAQAPRPGV